MKKQETEIKRAKRMIRKVLGGKVEPETINAIDKKDRGGIKFKK